MFSNVWNMSTGNDCKTTMCETTVCNEEEMVTYGRDIAKKISKGDVIYLSGNLGAGKTTLARGIIKGLGIEAVIKSPTYSLIEEYRTNTGIPVYHCDLYRIKFLEQVGQLGLCECGVDSILLLEWPERGLPLLPKAAHNLVILYDRNVRKILYFYQKLISKKLI